MVPNLFFYQLAPIFAGPKCLTFSPMQYSISQGVQGICLLCGEDMSGVRAWNTPHCVWDNPAPLECPERPRERLGKRAANSCSARGRVP